MLDGVVCNLTGFTPDDLAASIETRDQDGKQTKIQPANVVQAPGGGLEIVAAEITANEHIVVKMHNKKANTNWYTLLGGAVCNLPTGYTLRDLTARIEIRDQNGNLTNKRAEIKQAAGGGFAIVAQDIPVTASIIIKMQNKKENTDWSSASISPTEGFMRFDKDSK
jgi:hypothetical protein